MLRYLKLIYILYITKKICLFFFLNLALVVSQIYVYSLCQYVIFHFPHVLFFSQIILFDSYPCPLGYMFMWDFSSTMLWCSSKSSWYGLFEHRGGIWSISFCYRYNYFNWIPGFNPGFNWIPVCALKYSSEGSWVLMQIL